MKFKLAGKYLSFFRVTSICEDFDDSGNINRFFVGSSHLYGLFSQNVLRSGKEFAIVRLFGQIRLNRSQSNFGLTSHVEEHRQVDIQGN